MKSATAFLYEYGIDIGKMDDHFNCQLLMAMERYAEEFNRSQVGELPEGSHPDEIKPRAETWLKERANWESEVESLRQELSSTKRLFVKTINVLRDIMASVKLDDGVAKCDELIKQYS